MVDVEKEKASSLWIEGCRILLAFRSKSALHSAGNCVVAECKNDIGQQARVGPQSRGKESNCFNLATLPEREWHAHTRPTYYTLFLGSYYSPAPLSQEYRTKILIGKPVDDKSLEEHMYFTF
jgi:hypothetical protein